jgi:phosphorylase kinase alpha/beta subunit
VLLEELYHKASDVLAWSILRYSASLLRKIKDNLAPAVVEILVRQKTLTVGMPPEPREKSISRPISTEDILDLIYDACGSASPMTAFSQEIMIDISLLVRTQPDLFNGILRIRIGLIIQVLSQEIARSLNVDFDAGMDHLLRLEPFAVHELVCHLFAGKEIKMMFSNKKPGEGQSNLVLVNFSKKDMSRIKINISDVEAQDTGLTLDGPDEPGQESFSRGTWLRRRRVDGSLNRVPIGFYNLVWKLLDRCQEGISVEGNMLYAGWTQEMTLDELKFALRVEAVFSKLSQPEYRQVLIEALMVLASTVDYHYNTHLYAVVKVEDLARHANSLFLKDLQQHNPSSNQEELAHGIGDISFYFYDSAPSGRYGSLTYLTMATFMYLEAVSPLQDDKITCKVT